MAFLRKVFTPPPRRLVVSRFAVLKTGLFERGLLRNSSPVQWWQLARACLELHMPALMAADTLFEFALLVY